MEKPGLRCAAASDVGLREQNEDACVVGRIGEYDLFAVADGVGGHARGEVASRMAIRVFEETAGELLPRLKPAAVLERAFERANAAIYTYNQENRLSAATTLSAAIVDPSGECWIGTVGDSRTQIVTPSYVQGLVDAGLLSPAEAMRHPGKNILTQALGLAARVQAEINRQDITGATLVISSDGLHDYVPASAIQEIVLGNDPPEACRRLIKAAKDAASTDNITVIVARE